MKTNDKHAKVNNLLSAFLVIAYVCCMYFLENMSISLDQTLSSVVHVAMYVVFGLLLFYATRVGEGKQIRRFSLSVLLLIVFPGLYMVLAAFAPGLPFAKEITGSVMGVLGYIMLGYGIPYTFLSGFEAVVEKDETEDSTIFEEKIAEEDDGEEAAGDDAAGAAADEAIEGLAEDSVHEAEEADEVEKPVE